MKKYWIGLFIIFSGFTLIYFLFKGPIILGKFPDEVLHIDTLKHELNPLEKVDFSEGKNIAYLIFTYDDIEHLPLSMGKHKIFICNDNITLQGLKDKFLFVESGGDLATCGSSILVYNNDKVCLNVNIVIEENIIGIQSGKTGWAEANYRKELKNIFLKFQPVYKPFIRL